MATKQKMKEDDEKQKAKMDGLTTIYRAGVQAIFGKPKEEEEKPTGFNALSRALAPKGKKK